MNQVVLIGRLTSAPDIRTTPNGVTVAQFMLAVNRNFANANGEKEADFIRCVTFGKIADVIRQYLGKGSQVAVNGRIQTRVYETKDGKKQYAFEVVANEVQFLDTRKQETNSNQQQSAVSNAYFETSQNIEITDDDLPF